jgi:hypothetical protein
LIKYYIYYIILSNIPGIKILLGNIPLPLDESANIEEILLNIFSAGSPDDPEKDLNRQSAKKKKRKRGSGKG